MPRPCKRRRICALPSCARFGPLGGEERGLPVIMTLDEYESIRLIDYLGMTQEQCAAQMDVARATAQAIYASARAKLARCLVMRCALRIEGGDVALCGGRAGDVACAACVGRSRDQNGRNSIMKIAVTFENGQIFQHFGHTERFKLYETEGGRVVASSILEASGSGHGALAGLLMMNGVDALICGGIGGGAQAALKGFGIRIYGGVQGEADAAVEALLAGTLEASDAPNCNHHEHEDGHSCGDHDCGNHGCGDHDCGSHGCGGH